MKQLDIWLSLIFTFLTCSSLANATYEMIVPADSISPPGSANCSAAIIGKNVYVFGGDVGVGLKSTDLWYFEFARKLWSQVPYNYVGFPNAITGGRTNSLALPYNGKIWYIGGSSSPTQFFNDVHVFDPVARTLTLTLTTGNLMPASWGHRGLVYNNSFYIFGTNLNGTNCTTNLASDLYTLNPATGVWNKIIPSTYAQPSPRIWSGVEQYNNSIYVFGGLSNTCRDSYTYLNDFWKFNLATRVWTLINAAPDRLVAFPPLQARSRMFRDGDSMMIYGGIRGYRMTSVLTVIWTFDLIGEAWSAGSVYTANVTLFDCNTQDYAHTSGISMASASTSGTFTWVTFGGYTNETETFQKDIYSMYEAGALGGNGGSTNGTGTDYTILIIVVVISLVVIAIVVILIIKKRNSSKKQQDPNESVFADAILMPGPKPKSAAGNSSGSNPALNQDQTRQQFSPQNYQQQFTMAPTMGVYAPANNDQYYVPTQQYQPQTQYPQSENIFNQFGSSQVYQHQAGYGSAENNNTMPSTVSAHKVAANYPTYYEDMSDQPLDAAAVQPVSYAATKKMDVTLYDEAEIATSKPVKVETLQVLDELELPTMTPVASTNNLSKLPNIIGGIPSASLYMEDDPVDNVVAEPNVQYQFPVAATGMSLGEYSKSGNGSKVMSRVALRVSNRPATAPSPIEDEREDAAMTMVAKNISIPGYLAVDSSAFRKDQKTFDTWSGPVYKGTLVEYSANTALIARNGGSLDVSIKCCVAPAGVEQDDVQDLWNRELALLSKVYGGPNVQQLICYSTEPLQMITSPCVSTLHTELHDLTRTKWDNRAVKRQALIDVANGLLFLHNNGIVHNRLTPKNVYIQYRHDDLQQMQPQAVIGDFSNCQVSGEYDNSENANCGMFVAMQSRYTAPEVLTNLSTNFEDMLPFCTTLSDTYTFGMLMGEVMTREAPYSAVQDDVQIKVLVLSGKRPVLPADMKSPVMKGYEALIWKCTENLATKRPQDIKIVREILMKLP